MHGSQLNLKEWDARLEAVDAELNALKPPEDAHGLVDTSKVDTQLLDEATQIESDSSQKPTSDEQKMAIVQKSSRGCSHIRSHQ